MKYKMLIKGFNRYTITYNWRLAFVTYQPVMWDMLAQMERNLEIIRTGVIP